MSRHSIGPALALVLAGCGAQSPERDWRPAPPRTAAPAAAPEPAASPTGTPSAAPVAGPPATALPAAAAPPAAPPSAVPASLLSEMLFTHAVHESAELSTGFGARCSGDSEPRRVAAPCDRFLQQQQQHLAHTPSLPDAGAGGFELCDVLACWPAADGSSAWAVMPASPIRAHQRAEVRGTVAAARLDASGRVIVRGPAVPYRAHSFSGNALRGFTFDYDGDGRDELVLFSIRGDHSGGHGTRQGWLWTAKRGAVARVRTPAAFVDAMDFDADGRPDLVTDAPFTGETSNFQCGSSRVSTSGSGPYLLMHSLKDGRFSSHDAVATAAAKTTCPQPPAEPLLSGEDACSCNALEAVRCARLWGWSPGRIHRAIQVACKQCLEERCADCPNRDCSRCPPGSRSAGQPQCPLKGTATRWAAQRPPLELRP